MPKIDIQMEIIKLDLLKGRNVLIVQPRQSFGVEREVEKAIFIEECTPFADTDYQMIKDRLLR